MKLFIDSSQSKFVWIELDDNFSLIDFKEIETKFKVEEIIKYFDQKKDIDQIKEIYVNIGPGSFVGSRISLLYVRTMIQIRTNIKLFETTTFNLLSKQSKKLIKGFYIRATKQKSYYLTKSKVSIKPISKKESTINYLDIANNFKNYLSSFKRTDFNNLSPIYASEPQIGKGK